MKKKQVFLSTLFYISTALTYICKVTLLKFIAWISYILYFVNTYILIYSCYRKTKSLKSTIKRYLGDIVVTTVPIATYIIYKVVQAIYH